MNNLDDLLEITEEYDAITFDVFDTLIIRDVIKPTLVFRMAYGFLGRYLRILAEMMARIITRKKQVTLDDIQKFCFFSIQKEIEVEKRICRANPKIKCFVSELIKRGKKVYAISDMYLSEKIVSEILDKSGYQIPVTVSSEYNCIKSDGSLFKIFLEKYKYRSEQVIHFGDNNDADIKGANRAGIYSILIKKHDNELSYVRCANNNCEYASFINHGLCDLDDPVEKIGYEVVGPIVLSFCQWVHEKYIEQGFDRLYFLARDMRFTYETYKKIYADDDARYLCVSRRSLKYASENVEEFVKYLECEACFGNVAIVDTGWVGGMQTSIESYAKLIDSESDVGGLYLGTKLAFRIIKRSKRSFSCHFATIPQQFKCQLFPPFMETLIGCNEKQVVSYHDGKPIFNDHMVDEGTNLIKRGAKLFIQDWLVNKLNADIPSLYVRKPFERLFYCPLSTHIDMLGNLKYEDFKTTSIVSFDETVPYWKKPRKFMSDLSDSGWKGAFLKKFGAFYPFLLFAYYIFGTIRLYIRDVNAIKRNKINSNPESA